MQPQEFKQVDMSGGMIDASVILAPDNTVSLMLNADADTEVGSAVSRLGSSIVGTQLVASTNVLGLWQHIDVDTPSNNKLLATINASGGATSVIYNVESGLTEQTGLTASKKMRFLTYLGATLALNGADAERSYTSAGWITTGGAFDLANMPSSNKVNLCIEFLDRVYATGDIAALNRVYYSSTPTSGAISWTIGNGYVDIEAEDNGGAMTAVAKVPGYILFFKERSMHRWNFSSAFPESLIQVGTPSQESVIMGGGLCAFYSNSNEGAKGFYITDGGRPKCISQDTNRPIKKWVDAITSSNEANIAGWATDRYFCWSVGDLTVDGENYTNVVFKYNRILNQWTIRTYPNEFKIFAQYLSNSVNTIVGGADDGSVYRIDKSSTYFDSAGSTSVDSYGESNQSVNSTDIRSDSITQIGQSFTGTNSYLSSAKFYLKLLGTITGTLTAKLYAHTGTFGTSSVPTGSVLATSNAFNVAALTTNYQLIQFVFPSQYKMDASTKYCIVLDATGVTGDGSNYVIAGMDSTSPTHTGNRFSQSGGNYTADSTRDYCFYVSSDTYRNFGWKIRQNHLTYGSNQKKSINEKVIVRGKNIDSTHLTAFVNEDLFKPIGFDRKASNKVIGEHSTRGDVTGTTIAIEVAGESAGSPCFIREIELPNLKINNSYV